MLAKLDEVTFLMESLRIDAKENNLDPSREYDVLIQVPVRSGALTPELSERSARLEQVKIHGRDPKNADPIFTKEVCHGICILHVVQSTHGEHDRAFKHSPSMASTPPHWRHLEKRSAAWPMRCYCSRRRGGYS